MKENVASLLSYLFGAISGLIFFLNEKKSKFVKFNSMQSILLTLVFLAWNILLAILGFLTGIVSVDLSIWFFSISAFLGGLGWFVYLIIVIILMVNSATGNWFELPIIGEISLKQANKNLISNHESQSVNLNSSIGNEEIVENNRETKFCQFCGEKILAIAIKCKHCGSTLN